MSVLKQSLYIKRIKTIGCAVLLIVLLLAGLFFVKGDKRKVCGVSLKTEEQLEKLLNEKSETEGFSDILKFDGKPIPYDSDSKTFYISQNMNKKRWQGIITTDAGRLYFLEDENLRDKLSIISGNKRGKLYLIGSDSYELFEVCFSGMPVMNIVRDRDYVSFFSTDDNGIKSAEYVGNIDVRGGRSRRYKKKSFKLTFEDKQQLLDMRRDDDWILNALYDDMGLVHNAVSYEVWNQISEKNSVPFDNTVKQSYVEVLVDGDYKGVYGLSERIDDDFVGLKGGDIMYKASTWPDWEGDCMAALECKYPKEETETVREYIKSSLMDFFADNDKTYDKLKNTIYYDNALDFQIFIQLTVGVDNRLKNSYLIFKQDGEKQKVALIPWDCNATWGSHFQSYYAPYYVEETDVWSYQFERLYRADEKTASRDLYEEWLKLRQDVITEENICDITQKNLEYLHNSGAYERNFNRWPYYPQEGDDEPSLVDDEWKDEYIFEFINGRIEVLDKYFEEMSK